MQTEINISAMEWWSTQRPRYNKILIVAAPTSFASLLLVWWAFESRLPCLEITGLSIALGGILFLIGLGLANLCYFFGPFFEKILNPKNAHMFRQTVFYIGTGFSISLIFFPVIGNLIAAVFGPAAGIQCK
ncbi:hypothetical protein AAKU58_004322 [Oxalobacteraceae bacterium GrIS 1.18]